MNDLISRQAAIDALHMHLMYRMGTDSNKKRLDEWINGLPSAQETHEERTETHACDLIDRQAAIDALDCINGAEEVLRALPPAQLEPLSDAYTKAVWTWLIDYQIKAAELKGRYTPYEVLSWVANDWRKEHERSD